MYLCEVEGNIHIHNTHILHVCVRWGTFILYSLIEILIHCPFYVFFKGLFYFVCVIILPVYMYVCHVSA